MKKSRRSFTLEFISFACCLFVTIMSASSIHGQIKTPLLIGLIAGSFGAGATLANAVRNYADQRKKERQNGAEG